MSWARVGGMSYWFFGELWFFLVSVFRFCLYFLCFYYCVFTDSLKGFWDSL